VIIKALSPSLEQRWSSAADMERAIINLPSIAVKPPIGPIMGQEPSTLANPQTPNSIVPGATRSTPASPLTLHTTNGPAGSYILSALGFINANRVEDAYGAVQQAYRLEPNNAIVHRLFGQVFARRRPPSPDQAVQAYTRSLQLNPNDPETHKLLADVSLFLRRQPVQAIGGYTQALRLRPNDIEAHERLGQCYEETNQLEPALREYQEAVRLAPNRGELHARVGQVALRMNQLPVAERAFVAALTRNPADHQARFLLSQVYESQGKFSDAERECAYVVLMIPAAAQMLQRIRSRLGR